jgi:hypothetical protein
MKNFFLFNNATNTVELNTPDLLLIKEFSELVNKARNKTKEDPKGDKLSRAFREFTYIYLMLDWTSPYSDYSEQERHLECLKDAGLTEKEWNDPIFRAACRKYREMQNSSRVLKLIKSAQGVIDKITDYFDTLDIQERDAVTGKPIFKTKDVMAELGNVSGIVEQLKTLEILYKKEQEQSSSLMGNVDVGFAD